MADDYCGPLDVCANIDGRLLIEQTFQGPPLALGGDIGINELTGKVALRPYLRLRYQQYWIPKELCKGPIRSIVGLAPSETMSFETRQLEQSDFVRLVQEVAETSEVSSISGPAGMIDNEGNALSRYPFWCFPVVYADKFGSFWETVGEIGGAALGAVVGGPIGAAAGAWLGGIAGGLLGGADDGGAGTGHDTTMGAVDQVLESVTRTNSERVLTETTTSRSSLFERTVSRTFTNPYKDRALQLRFIPVFRHFDVMTVFWEFEPGFVVNILSPKFRGAKLSPRLGDFVQRHVLDPRIVAISTAELGIQEQALPQKRAKGAVSPLSDHLNANSDFYAKRYLKYLDQRHDLPALHQPVLRALATREKREPGALDDIGRSLRWSRSRVQGTSIYTPFAPPDILVKTLPGFAEFPKIWARFEKFRLKRVERHKDVHLFAGTIIEPAPGECVLQAVPA